MLDPKSEFGGVGDLIFVPLSLQDIFLIKKVCGSGKVSYGSGFGLGTKGSHNFEIKNSCWSFCMLLRQCVISEDLKKIKVLDQKCQLRILRSI
jgi:hypothetical protein